MPQPGLQGLLRQVFVGNSENLDVVQSQEIVSRLILFGQRSMDATIKFHRQTVLGAVEIYDESVQHLLAPELQAETSSATK